MALVTGPTVDQAISDPGNVISHLVDQHEDDGTLIEQLYLRILNRPAKAAEIDAVLKLLGEIDSDHIALTRDYQSYQVVAAELAAAREVSRQSNIADAKGEVTEFELSIAPREEELDRKQQQAIALATTEQLAYGKTIPEKLLEWEKMQAQSTRWELLMPEKLQASSGSTLTLEEDGAVRATGELGMGTYTFTAPTDLAAITAVRIEALADPGLPGGGPGRGNGNFVLSEFQLDWTPAAVGEDVPQPTRVALHHPKADFSQSSYDVGFSIDGKIDNSGWAISPKMGSDKNATYELTRPIGAVGSTLTFTLHQNYDANHVLGKFRIWVTTSQVPVEIGLPIDIASIVDISEDARSEDQRGKLLGYFTENDPGSQEHQKKVSDAKMPRPVDPELLKLRKKLARVEVPTSPDSKLMRLERAMKLSEAQLKSRRLTLVQDIAWALINSPAFLFNR
jgi:hypothetical protein